MKLYKVNDFEQQFFSTDNLSEGDILEFDLKQYLLIEKDDNQLFMVKLHPMQRFIVWVKVLIIKFRGG